MTLHAWQTRIRSTDTVKRSGHIRTIHATHVVADGPGVPLGTLCEVDALAHSGPVRILAEVVGVHGRSVTLAPFDHEAIIVPGAEVVARAANPFAPVGDAFLGRAVDPLGRPLDGRPAPRSDTLRPLHADAPAPLERSSPRELLQTGIRAIDGLLPLARGQRVGVFAAAGVGKTSLVTQLASQVQADRIVVALIGERGREVAALWDQMADARERVAFVAATSDQSASLRVRAGLYAMALAEYWRAQGQHVLLVMDSATRLAMALREVGLAAGEPPTVRAYTPNVFSAIPRLVERAGALRAGGAISMIMTVLGETDDLDDPISEMMKSLLDGHILLSRTLAEQGQFPAIDVSRSVSRLADHVATPSQLHRLRRVASWIAAYEQSRLMRQSGLYVPGHDILVDEAVARHDRVIGFLSQGPAEFSAYADTDRALGSLTGDGR